MVELTKMALAEPNHRDGNTDEDVYHFYGGYSTTEFRVPAGTVVHTQDNRWTNRRSTDPRTVMPNMEVKDGVIVLPISDLITEIVARAEPAVLAKELWQNEDVKAKFMYCVTERYSEGGVDDGDRRALIEKLKETVHSVALDRLGSAMSALEWEARRHYYGYEDRANYARHYAAVLEFVENRFGAEARVALEEAHGRGYVPMSTEPSIGGAEWHEGVEHWRAEVLRNFPAPAASPETADVDPVL